MVLKWYDSGMSNNGLKRCPVTINTRQVKNKVTRHDK